MRQTKELSAALKRLSLVLRTNEGLPTVRSLQPYGNNDKITLPTAYVQDLLTCAQACLDEDDQNLTREWLIRVAGFYPTTNDTGSNVLTHPDSALYLRPNPMLGCWDVFVEVYDLGTVETRDDVLDLLRSLHVQG